VATPTLVITATLNTDPVSRDGELSMLQWLTELAVTQVRGAGGAATSGTVNLPANVPGGTADGSATFAYTPNAAS
jgi:hypothetical protein